MKNGLINIIINHTKLTLVKMLLIHFNKQSEFSYKVIQTEYQKPLVMIKNDHEYFVYCINCWICIKNIWERWSDDALRISSNTESRTVCWICIKNIWERRSESKDHDHISSVFWINFGPTKLPFLCFFR